MLEKIREGSQGLIIKIVLGAVILSFALAGIGSYIGRPVENLAAIVNGEKIRSQELEQAYQNQRARMEAQLGEMFSQLASNEGYIQQLRASALENLIDEALLDQAVAEAGIRISDEQVKNNIRSMQEFQRDGSFDNERYLALIRNAGYSVAGFREVLRGQMARAQLVSAAIDSEFVLPAESDAVARLLEQKRTIRYWNINTNTLADAVVPTEEELRAHYDANQFGYQQPEQVAVQYIELNVEKLEAGIEVTEEEADQYYSDNSNSYITPEERSIAHILVSNDKDDAKQVAEDLLAQIKGGADFAAIAKEHSDDAFSAQDGGKLAFMDPSFEAPAAELTNVGDISEVVETSFGFHILKLLELTPEVVTPFSEVRDAVIAEVKKEKAYERFYELQQVISDLAFEVPDSLNDAAEAAELEIQTSSLFARNQAPAPLNHPKLNDAAFSEAVLLDSMNSDVIETRSGQLFVVRLNEHQPARNLTFDEVKDRVVAEVKQQQGQAKADEIANQLKALLSTGVEPDEAWLQSNSTVAVPSQVIGRFDNMVPASVRTAAYEAMRNSEGSSYEVAKQAGRVSVVAIDGVSDIDRPAEEMLNQLKPRLVAQYSDQAYRGMLAVLRANAEISYPKAAQ